MIIKVKQINEHSGSREVCDTQINTTQNNTELEDYTHRKLPFQSGFSLESHLNITLKTDNMNTFTFPKLCGEIRNRFFYIYTIFLI